jgi:hypothetical protein
MNISFIRCTIMGQGSRLFDPSDALNGLSRCHFEDQGGREKTVAQPTESRIRCNSRAFSCNLAPLCCRHHRLKTLTRWGYTTVEPGVFLWTAPHGRQYLRDHTGTLDVTPVGRSPGEYDGCQHPPDG